MKLGFTARSTLNQKPSEDRIYLAGGLAIGIQLPQSAESQFPNEWTWTPNRQTLGGHCVWLTGYTATYVALVTWVR